MNFTYEEFLQFFNQLKRIKRTIETKYYDADNKMSYGTLFSQESAAPSIVHLNEPDSLKIPEIFIINGSGSLLFHYDITGKAKSRDVDNHLLSGLISAIQTFTKTMGWSSGITLIRAEDVEIRFTGGNFILLAMVSSIDLKLHVLVEPILNDFAQDLCQAFEKEFKADLVKVLEGTLFPVGSFEAFQTTFNEILEQYKNETLELYQKMILTEAIALDVPPEICSEMVHYLSEGQDVTSELKNLIENYPLLKKAIQHVNQIQRSIWQIFSIPIFEID
jgi:hypothetical protein